MTTVNVTAQSGTFPFNEGTWESAGAGYCIPDGGEINQSLGSTDTTTIGAATIYAAGWVHYRGGDCFILVFDQDISAIFTSVAVTLSGGPTNTYTLSDGDLVTDPSGSSSYTYLWEAGNQDFVNAESTQMVFNDVESPSVSIDPTSATITLGTTYDFTATTANPSGNSVVWSCLYGTIGNGTYTAPDSYLFSYDTVTVALQDDPSIYAQATVYLEVPTITVQGAYRSPGAFPPVMITKAATINPKIYMPVSDTTVKTKP